MKHNKDKKWIALIFLLASAIFFALGFLYPLMQTGYGLGPVTLYREDIYLSSSFRYFFDKGEMFIGLLLLFFTIIFPLLKYIFLFSMILGPRFRQQQLIGKILDILNKWAMLDVFVVAVLILNLKFDSVIIISRLGNGTSLFALSVVLLMLASYLTKKYLASSAMLNK